MFFGAVVVEAGFEEIEMRQIWTKAIAWCCLDCTREPEQIIGKIRSELVGLRMGRAF